MTDGGGESLSIVSGEMSWGREGWSPTCSPFPHSVHATPAS